MTYKPGDKVSVDHPKYPGIWTVKRTGPVNAVLTPAGGGADLRAPMSLLIDPTETSAITLAALYNPGEFVRIAAGKWAGLWIVLKDGGDKVNLVKPGGDGGKYLRAIKHGLVRVAADEVMK